MRDLVLTPKKGLTDPSDSVRLQREGKVTIGRTGTLKVHDELVSIHHAQVFFDPASERFYVRDLDSSSGTIVDGECIRGDLRPIRAGTVLRFGSSVVRVEYARIAPRWVRWSAMASLGAAALVPCCLGISRCNQDQSVPLKMDGQRVWLADGWVSSLEVPPTWLRRHGLPWSVKVADITDHDSDDISELWLHVGEGKEAKLAIVTFAEDGSWVDLGLVPRPYRSLGRKVGSFPILEAAGETWEMDPESGRYSAVSHEGVVVWYREPSGGDSAPEAKAKGHEAAKGSGSDSKWPFGLSGPEPLKVARIPVKDPKRLGEFFVDRGIYGKVHYVICEGAFEGVRAQVLTAEGAILPLSHGCIEELRFDASPGSKIVGKPHAVALTPAGRRALVDDVLTFYAGEPTDLFLSADDAEDLGGLRDEPGAEHAATRLIAGGGGVVWDPFPKDAPLPDEPRALESVGRLYSPSPPAWSIVVEGPGTREFELGNGRTERFLVAVADDLTVTVSEVSTGVPSSPLTVPPSSSGDSRRLDDLEVRVRIDHLSAIDPRVRRIRVGVRQIR